MIYLFNVLFYDRVLSYFAKPNFIVYDDWFDNDFKKTKINFKKLNYKVGASENNLQIEIDHNREELFNNYSWITTIFYFAI